MVLAAQQVRFHGCWHSKQHSINILHVCAQRITFNRNIDVVLSFISKTVWFCCIISALAAASMSSTSTPDSPGNRKVSWCDIRHSCFAKLTVACTAAIHLTSNAHLVQVSCVWPKSFHAESNFPGSSESLNLSRAVFAMGMFNSHALIDILEPWCPEVHVKSKAQQIHALHTTCTLIWMLDLTLACALLSLRQWSTMINYQHCLGQRLDHDLCLDQFSGQLVAHHAPIKNGYLYVLRWLDSEAHAERHGKHQKQLEGHSLGLQTSSILSSACKQKLMWLK